MVKTSSAVRNFLVFGMIIGFVIVVLGQVDDVTDLIPPQLRGFEILSVDQDPTTGEIKGNVILGKPEVSGHAWTGSIKSSACLTSTQGGLTKNYPASFGTGIGSFGGCTYGFAEWDLSELPDDLVITSMIFKVKDSKFFPSLSQGHSVSCKIGIIEQPVDTIATSSLVFKFQNPDQILQEGNWCSTSGEKSFILTQTQVDAFTRALKGDNKITLSFATSTLDKGTGCCWNADSTFWGTQGSWVINGFAKPIQCAVGTHQVGFKCEPLVCQTGFEVNGNICSKINCPVGTELVGSICKPIVCNVGEKLVGNSCEKIICPIGTTLVGNDCNAIICNEGFTLSGNECTPIVCPTGNELVGSKCQKIVCPIGTFLQGNDCMQITCPTGNVLEGNNCVQIVCNEGEMLVGNICKPIQCQIGERLVGSSCERIVCKLGENLVGSECQPIICLSTEKLEGDKCVPKPLECPVGTIAQQNVCVQFLPQLQATGAPPDFITIAGLGILLISFAGFVFRGIRNRSLQ